MSKPAELSALQDRTTNTVKESEREKSAALLASAGRASFEVMVARRSLPRWHGSRCPLIKALKTRYGALARQSDDSDSDLASLEWGTFSRQRQASGGWGEASEKALQDKPPAVQEFLRLIERLAREREGGRFYQGSDRGNRLGLHDWIFHHFNP